MPNNYIIISACRGTAEDAQRHAQLRRMLSYPGVQYNEAQGCYKGTVEQSLVVRGLDVDRALSIARGFEQESILTIGPDLQVTLLYPDYNGTGYRSERLGYWTEVQDTAGLDAYTVIGNKVYAAM